MCSETRSRTISVGRRHINGYLETFLEEASATARSSKPQDKQPHYSGLNEGSRPRSGWTFGPVLVIFKADDLYGGKQMSEKVELKVTGMSCGHCEMAVKKALSALDGVSGAEADHKGQKAVVEADLSKVTREAIIEAIKKAGYEAA